MSFEPGQVVYVGASRRECVVVKSGFMVVYVRPVCYSGVDEKGSSRLWAVAPDCLSFDPPAKMPEKTVAPHDSPGIREVRTHLPRRGLID